MRRWAILLVIGLTVSACTNSEQTGVTISVLEDVTETDFVARPKVKSIISDFEFDTYPWRCTTFRYGTMNSLVHNRRLELSLDGGTALTGNQFERDAEIAEFEKGIDSVLSVPRDDKAYRYSSIWKPIVEELMVLQKDTLNQITLNVYSDLQENNEDWFSVHRYKDLRLLQSSPDKVKDLFLEQAKDIVKNPSNIRVVVVYEPQTMKEDKRFRQMRQVYSSVFEELGVPIEFTAHLN